MASKPNPSRAPRRDSQQVIVRMAPELHSAVKARAEEEDRSMAQTIRRAVKRYLDEGAAVTS